MSFGNRKDSQVHNRHMSKDLNSGHYNSVFSKNTQNFIKNESTFRFSKRKGHRNNALEYNKVLIFFWLLS